jgi:AMMECR1 domain-containing protein
MSLWMRLRVLYIALVLLFFPPCGTALLGQTTPASATVTLNTPAAGATELFGNAYGIDPNTTKVVIYALTNQWYVQPLTDAPFTNISADGSWSSSTNLWSSIVVLLVNPANYTPAATEITNPALDPGVIAWTIYPSQPVSVDFSGRTWGIKVTGNAPGDQFDPGPNFWSSDPSVVNVAADGLHLKITQIDGMWQCGEVYLTQSLGYGTYTVQVSSHLDQLDQNTVAAPLFIYAAPGQELDNEYSGAGGLIGSPYNAQFVVQPYTVPGNLVRYVQPSTAQFTSQMDWHADHVTFTVWNGWSTVPAASDIIYQWTYTGSDIPPPGQERVHINLWLDNGYAPVSGVGDEMVINSFTFQGVATPGVINLPTVPVQWDIAGAGDFNGDGFADLVWQNTTTGQRAIWLLKKGVFSSSFYLPTIPVEWRIAAVGDFNGDGNADLVWEDTITGQRAIWLLKDGVFSSSYYLPTVPVEWHIAGAGDFNGDGNTDLVWENTITGQRAIWLLKNGVLSSSFYLPTVPVEWHIAGAGDFNGDGFADLVWENTTTGQRAIWLLKYGVLWSSYDLPTVPVEWHIAGVGDFTGDGFADLVWEDTITGQRGIWILNAGVFSSGVYSPTVPVQLKIEGP